MSPLFSTVGHVFLFIACHPESRVREIASHVKVTDRTVIVALSQLVEAGLVTVERRGRRNAYTVAREGRIRAGSSTLCVGELLRLLEPDRTNNATTP